MNTYSKFDVNMRAIRIKWCHILQVKNLCAENRRSVFSPVTSCSRWDAREEPLVVHTANSWSIGVRSQANFSDTMLQPVTSTFDSWGIELKYVSTSSGWHIHWLIYNWSINQRLHLIYVFNSLSPLSLKNLLPLAILCLKLVTLSPTWRVLTMFSLGHHARHLP